MAEKKEETVIEVCFYLKKDGALAKNKEMIIKRVLQSDITDVALLETILQMLYAS